jgi:NifU-like protein
LGLKTITEITGAIKAGGACMSCHHKPGGLQDLLNEVWGAQPLTLKILPTPPDPREAAVAGRPPVSPYQFNKQVEKALDEYVRPMLAKDGGDVEIVDIKDNVVYCRLVGACAGCGGAGMTLKLMVERSLKEMVDDRVRIIAV